MIYLLCHCATFLDSLYSLYLLDPLYLLFLLYLRHVYYILYLIFIYYLSYIIFSIYLYYLFTCTLFYINISVFFSSCNLTFWLPTIIFNKELHLNFIQYVFLIGFLS